ncbi:MAG: Phytochrome-like protein cph2 [Candidatus Omnitrophica bacterium ADurb.Bin292]|jgi:diguanylate cyclase (GGDEF)-like protein/PAS domain S-box-containing protein|nr:MAG: Phytochrome-like protein cph2 [Candidatus Omnitrophica bacterium ADurb.Bin292]HPW77398.1 EAL domain-containing protein [Candidatus Omnitrophota bacterium]HQB12263.1 EAL domain-containing protein [Candidatus Omnitrophota bacterium]
MKNKVVRILVIEDDPNYFVLLNERLSQCREPAFEVFRAKMLQSGLERLNQSDIQLVLLDLTLPDSAGLDTVVAVRKAVPLMPVIILTGVDDSELAAKAISLGAQDYLVKGSFDRELLNKSILYALERHESQRELQKYYQENQESQRTLVDKEERFKSLVSNIPGAVYRYSLNTSGTWDIEFISEAIYDIVGIRAKEFVGQSIQKYFDLILPQDREMVREAFNRSVQSASVFNVDYRIFKSEKDFRWVHEQGRGILGEGGKVTHVDGVMFDVTERTKEKERFHQLVYYDALTGLPNRELFMDRLDQSVKEVKRKKESGAVLIVDLDHFKRINDTLGHGIGDQLIKAVSVRLQKIMYESDTISRIGGGSFMFLLPKVAKSEHAENVANKILTAFKSPFRVQEHDLFTTCSVGIALFPQDGEDPQSLIKNADAAMHLAKDRGKDRYQLYSSSIANNSFERMVLENSLRRALEKDEFRLHYQPQLDLRTGKVVGVETLVRWQHPDLGSIPPLEFIPIAEETGLIHPIGEWILRTACEQKSIWQKAGFRQLRVSVNLSARQFHYANMVDMVMGILRETGIDPKSLDLEITESTIMERLEETTETLRRLKEMGCHITIDDFGTGYSSLTYLKTFPINMLKIDKSFVDNIVTDADDRAITQAIISMAHSLKLEVVAEGVEEESQLEILKMQGCDILQGFLFSKPLPADDVTRVIEQTAEKVSPSQPQS